MRCAIFIKGKDGFLYPHLNLENCGVSISDIQDFSIRELLIKNIKESFIGYRSDIESIEEFDEKYKILFEI